MTDRILLYDLAFYGYHGVRPEEKKLGQRFLVDLELWLDLGPAGRADDVELTVNYSEAYRVVRDVVEGEARDTLEAVAHGVADTLLGRFEKLDTVLVRVKKPSAPIRAAYFGMVAVEITRGRGGQRS